MLQPQEEVFFRDLDYKVYPGIVLGSETDDFWLLVPDLGNVYQGHPDRVKIDPPSGRKWFEVHDRCKAVDEMFDQNGEFISDIFYCANDPEPMKKYLKMYKLIGRV